MYGNAIVMGKKGHCETFFLLYNVTLSFTGNPHYMIDMTGK